MKTLASFLKAFSPLSHEPQTPVLANPSLVLRVHRDEPTESSSTINLNDRFDNPSKVLRASWVNKAAVVGNMKTVWVREEVELI